MERFLNFLITIFPLDSENNVLGTTIFSSNYIIYIYIIILLVPNDDNHEIAIEIMLHTSNDVFPSLSIPLENIESNSTRDQ